jgi:drug/metabolite transporter (DMT)-like permease
MMNKALIYVLLIGILQGTSLVISRFSLGQFEPAEFVSLRLMLASSAHLALYLVSRSRPFPRDRVLWLRSSVLGVFGTAIVLTTAVASLQYMSSGMASLLFTLSPVLVIVLAQVFLKDEKLTRTRVLGVTIALVGAGALLLRGETGLGEMVQADWRGYALAGLALTAGSGTSIFAHRYLRSFSAYDVASIRMFSACLALFPLVALTIGYDFSRVTWSGYLALLYGGLIGGFSAFLLDFYVLKRFGATASSMTTYVIPVVTTALGVIFMDEHVTPLLLFSMVLVLTGVWLLNRRPAA